MLRLYYASLHSERSSVEGIVRFVRFRGRQSRADYFLAEPTIGQA
jgi:hypothetical protein